MTTAEEGYFFLHPRLLSTLGTSEYLRRKSLIPIRRGEEMPIESLIETLIDMGYIFREHFDELGTYSRDGSILHVRDRMSGYIWSIEWFDTEIDSIIERSLDGTHRVFRDTIEIKNEKKLSFEVGENINPELLHELTGKIIVFGCDFLHDNQMLLQKADIHISDFAHEGAYSLDVSIPEIHHIDELIHKIKEMRNIATMVFYTKYEKTVREFLEFHTLTDVVTIVPTTKLGLESFFKERDFFEPDTKPLLVITDDILSEIFVRSRTKKSLAKNLDLLLSLRPGDYVVHRDHGIARFHDVVEKSPNNIRREYVELHYAEGDKLFVPLTEIYRVSKYIGEIEPELTRLTGKEWERTLEKTDEEIEKIATELLEISAKRSLAKGFAFAKFSKEEEKFLMAFPYEHTIDQRTAIEEVAHDMESDAPMDRLLSGDVGFGKTEVAMNAIYKAVLSGAQVAVISPLLVLADEHYETFQERLTPFGVRVGVLSRMNTPREQAETLKSLRNGTIDVVVGTHRLLSDDVHFKKLGLLIIDEEHKFGVTHKERFKKFKAHLDILSLSATPIPRSLNLALSGLKKISLLTTPPKKKKPIETIVTRWNESTLMKAIEFERARGGQIIIIHNRIQSLPSVESEIIALFRKKDAPRIITTHGQMSGDMIEERIHAFKKQEYDILLTTTIIENGVNFLSANTIIITDAHDFGLAQLHQLRGRVGRKGEQGYCYLVYRKSELTSEEKERILTIVNNTHLGAGFEIAMRDMEIRGAGDVLGIKQAGKSKDVGLTLYFRMLEEKIESIKHERQQRKPVKIELDLSYAISDAFFLSEVDKLSFFRDIESIESIDELDNAYESFAVQFSENTNPSERIPFENLFLLLRTRLILAEYGVKELKKVGVSYVFDFDSITPLEKVKAFLERFDRKKRMILLSAHKIRIEMGYFTGAEGFLRKLCEE